MAVTSLAAQGVPGSVVCHFVDVGQGDATVVIENDTKSALVVDCASKGVAQVAGLLAAHGASIDTMLVTHWDLDHYGGIARLLTQMGCRRLLYNHDSLIAQRDEERSKILATLRQILSVSPTDVELGPAPPGRSGTLGVAGWTLLAPTHRHLTQAVAAADRNLASGVVLIEAHGHRILVGGDADSRVWDAVLDANGDLEAEILRYPHHGSLGPYKGPRPIAPVELVKTIGPSHAVFSVGTNNTHGHPLPEAIHAVGRGGARVMCTQATERCHSGGLRNPTACAGDVAVYIAPGGLTVSPTQHAHGTVIDGWTEPLCR